MLGSTVKIRYYFDVPHDAAMPTVNVFEGDGASAVNTVTEFQKGKTLLSAQRYYFDLPIKATKFDTDYTVTFSGTTHSATYSVNIYVLNAYDPYVVEGTNAFNDLLNALYCYGSSAVGYSESIQNAQ